MAPTRLPSILRRPGSTNWYIRPEIGGKQRWKSLDTTDTAVARQRAPEALRQLQVQFSVPASQKGFMSVDEVCRKYRELTLATIGFHRHVCETIARSPQLVDDAVAALQAGLEEKINSAVTEARLRDFRDQAEFLDGLGVSVVDRDATLFAMARERIMTLREVQDQDREWATLRRVDNGAKSGAQGAPTLTAELDTYIAHRGAALSPRAAEELRIIVRDFTEVASDKAVTSYTKADARAFKEVLLALPANRMKLRETRDLGIVAAATRAKELCLPPMQPKTAKIKWQQLRLVFDHVTANYDDAVNPFLSPLVVGGSASAADQRDAFTPDEVRRLLASKLPGDLKWLVPLGVYAGARLNELCQLRADLVRQKPVPHIYFAPDLRLKTGKKSGSSIRAVPLHPALVALGFLDFATKANGPLFPDLKKDAKGLFSDVPSKAFARHLKALGMKRNGLSFHSLRHSFAAAFKRQFPTDIETRERLMGHVVVGVAGRYGNSYETEAADTALLASRARVVAALDFF